MPGNVDNVVSNDLHYNGTERGATQVLTRAAPLSYVA